MLRQIARTRPVPGSFDPGAAEAYEALEHAVSLLLGEARPFVLNAEPPRALVERRAQADQAAGR